MRPAGHIVIGDPGSDRVIERDTLQCVHCGAHFVIQPGSGNRRGFCLCCNGPTCGRPECDVCVPTEQKLENIEAGRPIDHRTPRVAVGGLDCLR